MASRAGLGVSPGVIDEKLAHNASSEDGGTSKASENAFSIGHLLEPVEDPRKAARNELADALVYIERNARPSSADASS